jgi:hypothetical protein
MRFAGTGRFLQVFHLSKHGQQKLACPSVAKKVIRDDGWLILT